jgi:hypothetical protein
MDFGQGHPLTKIFLKIFLQLAKIFFKFFATFFKFYTWRLTPLRVVRRHMAANEVSRRFAKLFYNFTKFLKNIFKFFLNFFKIFQNFFLKIFLNFFKFFKNILGRRNFLRKDGAKDCVDRAA